jgi:hypothetical protein
MCLGLRYAADNCPLYLTIQEAINIDLPVGCLPGYHVKIDGKG